MPDASALQDTVFSTPLMKAIDQGLVVQKIETSVVPLRPTENGAVSIGPGHVPDVGGVIHDRDGSTLLVSLGGPAFNRFARLMNRAAEAIQRGDFDKPETRQ